MDALINDPFVSGIFLFAGLACMILEVFLPSGGVLGLLAIAATGFGIFGFFHQGHTILAFLFMAFSVGSFWTLFKFMLRRLKFPATLSPETANSVDRRIADLVGREGVTLTPLRPAGMAHLDGRKVDVVTLGDFIEKDVPIRVVDNSGNRVVVRQIESRSTTP
jgi:membrane-bound serine protease (ClpP class)